jgi:hypothetical protein
MLWTKLLCEYQIQFMFDLNFNKWEMCLNVKFPVQPDVESPVQPNIESPVQP